MPSPLHPLCPGSTKRVRFVDPQTNRILDLEPLTETPSTAVTPHLGRNIPAVGALALIPLLAAATISWTWDVRFPVEVLEKHWVRAQQDVLEQSATRPPATLLHIRSPHLPWKVEIRPRTPNLFVTVYDVLSTIHGVLEPRITPQEWKRFEPIGKRVIVAERETRVRSYAPDRQVDEAFNHPRRIDSLGEFTRFAGLIPAPQRGPNEFDLKFKRRG